MTGVTVFISLFCQCALEATWQADKASDMLEPSNATEQGHASDVGKTVISSLAAESLPTQEPEAAAVEAGETQLGSVTHGVTETKKGTDDMEVEAAEARSLG